MPKKIERQKRIGKDKRLLKRHQRQAEELRADKIRLEEELRLRDKLAALGRLAAGVAHELNNPMSIVKGNAQYLLGLFDRLIFKDVRAEGVRECRETLESITNEIDRCTKIISNLLQLSHKRELAIAPIDVNEGLEEVLSSMSHAFSIKKINVNRELAPHLPLIMGDHDSLRQVFLNIIINAQEAMPNGGDLTVKTYFQEIGLEEYQRKTDVFSAGDKVVIIEISDTGRGIPEGEIKNIFNPFYNHRIKGSGMGLGLSISYAIIRDHHGTIDIKSQGKNGSTFIIKLPVLRTLKHEKSLQKRKKN